MKQFTAEEIRNALDKCAFLEKALKIGTQSGTEKAKGLCPPRPQTVSPIFRASFHSACAEVGDTPRFDLATPFSANHQGVQTHPCNH